MKDMKLGLIDQPMEFIQNGHQRFKKPYFFILR